MKKRVFRVCLTVISVITLFLVLTVFASAEKKLVAEGYCPKGHNDAGQAVLSNIKWEVYNEDGNGVIYFSIDKAKGNDTVLYAKQKDGSDLIYWKSEHYTATPWGEYTVNGTPVITTAVIGAGITEINGPILAGSKVTTLEMPKSVVTLIGASLARMSVLKTVNITGEKTNPGVVNLKYVTSIGGNNFEGDGEIVQYALNPDYKGELGFEMFKQNNKLRKLEIPTGVAKLGTKLFNEANNVARLIINGRDTEIAADAFDGMKNFPRIVGYIGSKAEAFAKSNGHTFINIETQETVHEGTKPLADDITAEEENPFIPEFEKFDPTGATAHGHMTGTWENATVIDTYWAYYADTKTLKLVS